MLNMFAKFHHNQINRSRARVILAEQTKGNSSSEIENFIGLDLDLMNEEGS
jgi:hypothetical protein